MDTQSENVEQILAAMRSASTQCAGFADRISEALVRRDDKGRNRMSDEPPQREGGG